MKTYIKEFPETMRLPIPNGRELTEQETERMWVHYSEYSWAMRADDEGRVYFGNGEDESNDDTTFVRNYVMIEDIMKLPLVKEVKKEKKSPMLQGLQWYNKLMKKIN